MSSVTGKISKRTLAMGHLVVPWISVPIRAIGYWMHLVHVQGSSSDATNLRALGWSCNGMFSKHHCPQANSRHIHLG